MAIYVPGFPITKLSLFLVFNHIHGDTLLSPPKISFQSVSEKEQEQFKSLIIYYMKMRKGF